MPLSSSLTEYVEKQCLALPSKEKRGLLAVIDTNVVLDLLFWHDPNVSALKKLIDKGAVTPIRDRESMLELAEVGSRTTFLNSEAKAGELVRDWCSECASADEEEIARTKDSLTVRCKDPLDQKFLVLAVASKASLLISKDKLVLKAGKKLRRYGITCIKPEEIAKMLSDSENPFK